MSSTRLVSLASLSALAVPPPRFIEYAAAGGFDAVGVRVSDRPGERGHLLAEGSRLLADTLLALDDHGLAVLDVEVVKIHPGSSRSDWEPVLFAGAALGARYLIATVLDDDADRAGDNLAALAQAAAQFGLRCCLEPMVFTAVRDLRAGRALLDESGATEAGLLLDALHWSRAGGTVDGLGAEVERGGIPYWQLCDARMTGPARDDTTAMTEARGNRLPPGAGALPLRRLAGALGPSASVSVEVPSARGAADPRRWAIELGTATRRLLARVPSAPVGSESTDSDRCPTPGHHDSKVLS
ncbi:MULTISPECIES: sugar phosphate isomerase/epimerase [unclassified Gordonia (in: high G+C Gram-positive bacteria)]|uniref:sugar phosphate isomerase/epimerase family protein n=1 Tax=Gordonia TaxID=2053 RepID=UPI00099131A4|nr:MULTISPECIES: TIM barrel protein [unclassified Gordonia (in: high G+C Gram-positive bacteria)]MCX2755329.1 TIM barrel protein [Gordonia sp. 4N]